MNANFEFERGVCCVSERHGNATRTRDNKDMQQERISIEG